MEIIISGIIASSFIASLALVFLIVKFTFPRIQGDEWEERYVQMKMEERRIAEGI